MSHISPCTERKAKEALNMHETLHQQLVTHEEKLSTIEDNCDPDIKRVFDWARQYLLTPIRAEPEVVSLDLTSDGPTSIETLLETVSRFPNSKKIYEYFCDNK